MQFDPERPLDEAGEFPLIEAVRQMFPTRDDIVVGSGDDAALLRIRNGHVVVSADMMVEGHHFRRDWCSAEDVGHRAAAQNLSDINAMGGRGHSLTVSIGAPGDLPAQWVLDFARGFADECALVDATVIGGDMTRADQIVIAVQVIGACTVAPVLRSGAEPDDIVALRGRQGWAAGGLAILGRGFRAPRVLVEAYRRPEVPYGSGQVAADAGASAMIDVSDGLLADAQHIADASGVQLQLRTADLEVPEPLETVGAAVGAEPLSFVLTGGDDHALLATFPPEVDPPEGWRAIGTVAQGSGITVDGVEPEGNTGWRHF